MTDKTKPSKYLQYLPAIYQIATEQPENVFLGQYLNIFEKILSGIADDALQGRKGMSQLIEPEIISNLFYPRLSFLFPDNTDFIPSILNPTPPATTQTILEEFNSYLGIAHKNADDFTDKVTDWLNNFLNWLGSWIAFNPPKRDNIDTKRQLIAQMLPLYRIRGTLNGLQQLLNLMLVIPNWLIGPTVINSVSTTGIVLAAESDPPTFILQDHYTEGDPVIGGMRPWFFQINLFINRLQLQSFNYLEFITTIHLINKIVAQEKPMHCNYQCHIQPTMQIGCTIAGTQTSLLGQNTVLYQAPIPSCLVIGGNNDQYATLGIDTWIMTNTEN